MVPQRCIWNKKYRLIMVNSNSLYPKTRINRNLKFSMPLQIIAGFVVMRWPNHDVKFVAMLYVNRPTDEICSIRDDFRTDKMFHCVKMQKISHINFSFHKILHIESKVCVGVTWGTYGLCYKVMPSHQIWRAEGECHLQSRNSMWSLITSLILVYRPLIPSDFVYCSE